MDQPGDAIGPPWAEETDYTELLREWECKPEELVSQVVYALTWRLKNAAAHITGIYCDQWCAVSAEGAPFATQGLLAMTGDDGKVVTWVQCGSVEWGFAATWKAMAEHFGKEN